MNKHLPLAIILALAFAVSFANIGGLDVYALDEAKNAEAARAMFESGDYVVPYYNGELRTDKPSLHYYFMAAGYQLFGVNAFGARFFSSIMGVLTILITFLFVRKNFSEKAAINSALVLIASIHFNLQFHMSVPDPYLVFFTTWAFFSFYEAYKTNSKWQLLSYYFAIGCGLLTKGPIALALPGLTALAFLIFNRDFKWKTIWRLQPFGGIIVSLLVAFPWYWQVHKATNGAWTDDFFFKHNFSRYSDAMEGHEGLFLLTFAFVFALGMLTFLPFVFQSLKHTFQQRKNDALLYCGLAVAIILVFFATSSTKLPNYTVPAYPVLAVILGVYVSQIKSSWLDKLGNRIGLIAYAVLLIGFPIGIYFGLKGDKTIAHLTDLSYYFIVLTIAGILILFYAFGKKNIEAALRVNVSAWIVVIILFFYLIFPKVDAENPVRKLVPQMDTSAKVISFKRLNAAFVFELEREITRYNDLVDIQKTMLQYEKGYIISRTEYRTELEQIPGVKYVSEARDLFENPTSLLMMWDRSRQ
ncbi:glycosyltransferase family 39 protein [Roseivirga sp. E12]|uniref:ArnT family glycosyltransferase n=1 Tax=Roseivirga sp. E12 TaxID=2819237 RepID=UPI001ABD2241|nr:glycosyltransferase family 39 protein [Roseivirga sp. E12]MBO3697320.1 glycosyltransferase family 39 protein [Roseivirga sp. E12]